MPWSSFYEHWILSQLFFSSFTFIKRLFSSSLLSAIRVVYHNYLSFLNFYWHRRYWGYGSYYNVTSVYLKLCLMLECTSCSRRLLFQLKLQSIMEYKDYNATWNIRMLTVYTYGWIITWNQDFWEKYQQLWHADDPL